jgi:hypothetical protein
MSLSSTVSVAPSSGGGLSQTFSWTASSPAGWASLSEVYGLLNTSVYGVNGCYIRYDRVSNLLYLADNGASYWMGGFAPGSAQTVENSQCKIFGAGASAVGAGTQLAVTAPVEFKAGFAGAKNNYLFARDNIGQYSGWQQMGTWTVSSTTQYTLSSIVAPAGAPVEGTVGLTLLVDGVPCTTPCTRDWTSGSAHTIAGTFRQQVTGTTYFLSYLGGAGVQQSGAIWSSGTLSFPVTAQGSATTLTAVANSNGLQALRDCLGWSASSNCVLAEGTHQVGSTINVLRPNVTIRGESADRTRSRLQRSSGHTYEMMKVDVAPPAESIAIQDLTFCGGSVLSTPGNGPRAHDDRNPAEIRGVAGGRLHQGQERHPRGQSAWREKAELRRPAPVGARILRVNGRP